MSWIEVELELDRELAEPVSELLARHCPRGVSITQELTAGQPSKQVSVRAYLPRDSDTDWKRDQIEQGLWHLSQIQDLPSARYRVVEDQDWSALWKEKYRPMEIGERLLVLPSWMDVPGTERLPVRIDPGMAFGTGTHPTTRLALLAVERSVQPGMTFADVGTGSGILSIAALKLGARVAYVADNDPRATELALENARLNGVENRWHSHSGSFERLLDAAGSFAGFDLVAANILAPTLIRLLKDGMADLLGERGSLILSGVLLDHRKSVENAIIGAGLVVAGRLEEGDWHAYLTRNKQPAQNLGGPTS